MEDGSRLIFNGGTSQWDVYHPISSDVQLTYLPAVDKGTVVNSIGTDAVIPLVDSTNAGLMQPADKAKVDSIVSASETAQGVIEIATQAETDAGTDDFRAITPKKLKANIQSLVPPTANDGQINISGGVGITASGSNASANQSVNTTRTLAVDTTWLGGWIGDNTDYLSPGDNVSELTNDAGYITAAEVPATGVTSVNGDSGPAVVLTADDVGALAKDISQLPDLP